MGIPGYAEIIVQICNFRINIGEEQENSAYLSIQPERIILHGIIQNRFIIGLGNILLENRKEAVKCFCHLLLIEAQVKSS